MHTAWHRLNQTKAYLKMTQATISGSTISPSGNNGRTTIGQNATSVENGSQVIYIWKVVGYKY